MTRVVKIGSLKVGGRHSVKIKGMLKTPTKDTKGLIKEAKRLKQEGVEAIRVAVKERKDAKLAPLLRSCVALPLVADVHFHSSLAHLAIEAGFDGIRLNPLNIYKKREVREIARAAKMNNVSIRVGINSGGFRKKFSSPAKLAQQMVKEAESYLKVLEREEFFDILVSLKGSDVLSTIAANKLFSQKFDYPVHLGITATGPFLEGVVKSSVGLGKLLCEGVGDVLRVSLSAPSFWEVRVAKHILEAVNLRQFGPQIISCPTCSRCEVDLLKIVNKFEKELRKSSLSQPLRVAIMGCVVNGPGEANQADIGVAFGKKKAAIFRNDKILKWSNEEKVVSDLMKEVERITS